MKTEGNRRGSVTVFLMLFFVALLSALSVFLREAKSTAVQGGTEALGQVWAQAILAEYDRNLLKRCGLFGYYGFPGEIEKKLNFYAKESFRGKNYIEYEGAATSLGAYSLLDREIFKTQAVQAGRFAALERRKEETAAEGTLPPGRIKNERILRYLPSREGRGRISLGSLSASLAGGRTIREGISSAGDRAALLSYIHGYFGNGLEPRRDSFFSSEEEYLLAGHPDDEKNLDAVRRKLIALREPVNLFCLKQDRKKQAEILAAAALIAPEGPEAAAEGISALWALAESRNDYALLREGYRIPSRKDSSFWATDLDTVLKNQAEGCIFTGRNEGEDYGDYLDFLLCAVPEETLLLRLMDLVQINMRYLYYDDFLLSEYHGGVEFTLTVNGEEYEVEKEYEKRELSR